MDRSSKRRLSRTFWNQRDAREFEKDVASGIAKPNLPTFRVYSELWLREYAAVEKKVGADTDDRSLLVNHIWPAFGDVSIGHLKRVHLMGLKAELSGKKATNKTHGLKPRTVNNALGLAKQILTWAVEREDLSINPFAPVKLLKVPEDLYTFWSMDEFRTFRTRAREIHPNYADLVTVAFLTGLRLGELRALRQEDLDWERGRILVSASVDIKTGVRHPTKNRTVAAIEMNEEVREVLSQRREDPIFQTNLFRNYRRTFQRLSKSTRTREIRFHDLRHSFASNLAMAGTDLMVIQRLMRHKSYQMTLRYAHLHPDHLRGATEILCTPRSPKTLHQESCSAST